MPHDRDGRELKVGDSVAIFGKVKAVCAGEFCTLEFETDEVMPGNQTKSVFSALNAKQVVKIDQPLKNRCPTDASTDAGVEAKLAVGRQETKPAG